VKWNQVGLDSKGILSGFSSYFAELKIFSARREFEN